MSGFKIKGGASLSGSIRPQGAKNEALQIICATLLSSEPVDIHNIPQIVDIHHLMDILVDLGVTVSKLDEHSYRFCASEIHTHQLVEESFMKKFRKIRGSVMIAGALLARTGHSIMPQPGGDKIGRRRLDTHFQVFEKLGAEVDYNAERLYFDIRAKKLQGAYILMEEASVTGTANALMTAVLADGETTIYNAACEPYLQQLAKMLVNMGANIQGIGSNLLIVKGVGSLSGTTHTMLPDMIEIGSWVGLAAMTRSELLIKDVRWDALGLIPDMLRKLGICIEKKNKDDMLVCQQDTYEVVPFVDGSMLTISDAPWPGFTPDLISVMLVVASQTKGSVLIHQKMFESRLFFVDNLIDMGAKIILCDPHRAVVIGQNHTPPLRATTMSSPDIRAGMSLLIAALSATGTSTIYNIEQIDRGYEKIDKKLKALGADIVRF